MPTTKNSVFLVEDDEQLRSLYIQLLEAAGCKVSTAANGPDALKMLLEGGYDLVLLDIMLPGMDGLEVIEQLRKKKPALPNKSIVLLTNLAENDTIARALKNGADGYIIKSRYTPEEFIEVVQKYLE